ncbi:MAG: HAMP domain-containing protein, partial [Planctomycetales bacterium]|nr:HAMP domain-containing protein [Planctomycetales bacterium]
MGGYQALQKVLGASSLERKCRLLFGASLFLLICGSFWWYSKTAEEMVHEKNRRTGQHLVDAAMLKTHFVKWHLGDKSDSLPSAKEPLLQDVIPVLENLEYDYQFLATERPFNDSMVELPGDADEEAILRQLKKELWALYRTEREKLEEKPPSEDTVAAVEGESAEYDPEEDLVKRVKPVFATRRFVGIGGRTEYRYYQAVFWYTQCISCHRPLGTGFENYEDHFDFDGTGVTDDVRQVPVFDESLPVHVVRVIIPDDPTQRAINRSRSVLIAAGIVTVFLAMLALYIIVRYVIVKPLRHLRDVSDEVGRGNYELRADLQTNDEFEDVARSFNRMVRHLVEAQDQLRTANSELDTKLDQLAQLNMQLYEMNQLKSGFLANMSHELRTPLNSIIGFADVLRGLDTLTDKQKRYASNIARSGRVLLDMINDILDLAKVESGKMKVRPSEFQIDVLARGQCDTV